MRRRKAKTIFCEFDFLQKFLGDQPKAIAPDVGSIRQMECWLSLYKFICKSNLILNVSKEEFFRNIEIANPSGELKDSSLFLLWKHSFVEFRSEGFPSFNKLEIQNNDYEILNSVFLTTCEDDAFCKQVSEQYGIIVVNVNSWKSNFHLYNDNGYAIRKGDTNVKGWNFLQGPQKQLNICNSLIIIDGYLFDDNKKCNTTTMSWQKKLDWNLKPILSQLLPKDLSNNLDLEVIIITGLMDDVSYQDQCERVQAIINELCAETNCSINVKVSIFLNVVCSKNKNGEDTRRAVFHDRCIISNNIWIGSGFGFGIFAKKEDSDEKSFPIQNTTVNVMFPFFQSHAQWVDAAYMQILNNVNDIISTNTVKGKNYWGNDYSGTCRMVTHYFGNDKKQEVETPKPQAPQIFGKIDLETGNWIDSNRMN